MISRFIQKSNCAEMSRHRNVRKLDLDDEMSEDVYGRSCEDYDYCVSPATEAEFMFRRDKTHTLSSFIDHSHEENIIEEGNDYYDDGYYDYADGDPSTQDKLQFCIEHLSNDVLVDTTQKKNANTPKKQKTQAPDYFPNSSGHVITTPKSKQNGKSYLRNADKNNESSPCYSGISTPTTSSRAQSNENLLDDSTSTPLVKLPKLPKMKDLVDVQAELQRRAEGKQMINLVVIGHVDAGKSTLMGHLLYNLGNVSKKVMHKNEMESKKTGKGSFAFAWVLDETEEERARGVTIDVAMTTFETSTKMVTLMDAPGHRDFIPNMIQGTSQADVAILVVDSRPGEFEAGFDAGGQTREHAILARSLGVGQLIVTVNKMDSVKWSKQRYDAIVIKLKTFLTKQAGFKESDVYYVPCSGLSGDNLTEKSKEIALTSWYSADSLVDLIDKFRAPDRPVDKPLRFCISDVYKGQGNISVAGKLETGHMQNGTRVMVMPDGQTGIIKGLMTQEEPVKFAAAGDHVTGALHGIDIEHVSVGSIICDIDNVIKTTTHIAARILVFENEIPITKGFMVVFHSQNLTEPATVHKLVSILNKASGEVVQKRPRCLTKQMNAIIEIKFPRPVCVELYRDNKILGRFMLRYSGKTIAAGVVTEIK